MWPFTIEFELVLNIPMSAYLFIIEANMKHSLKNYFILL